MKALRICTIVTALVLGTILLSSSVTVAQDSDPEAIYRAAYAAFNAGDIEGGMALIADDVVGVLLPPPPDVAPAQIGKEAFQAVMEDALATNMHWELSDFHVSGETASYAVSLAADDIFAELGVYPLEFTGFVVVRDGLIVSEVWSMNADSRAKIDKALGRLGNEETVRRYVETLWNEGDLTVADELLTEDFVSHNSPAGDRAALKQAVTDFHAENPGAYFSIDQLIMSDDQAIIVNRVWVVAEGAPEGDKGEPVGQPMVLILGLKDGKITERQLFMTPEE
ncbi:MAG: nuclear transport factor 2 family protein [Caldilineaceae bacterium]